MKVLILIAHPNHNGISTAHRLANAAYEALVEDGHEVRVVDIVKTGFVKCATIDDFTSVPCPDHFDYETSHVTGNENLIEEIRVQQDNVTWCTHIMVFGPMWFYRYPACFYAYTERVLNSAFGYTPTQFCENGPHVGKKVMCVVTLGGFPETYLPNGPQATVEGLWYHVTRGTFSYCGMTCLRSQPFYLCAQDESKCDDPEIMAKWKQAVKNLEHRPEIPFGPQDGSDLNEGQRICGLADLTLDEAINAK